jgi:hypothetical protein
MKLPVASLNQVDALKPLSASDQRIPRRAMNTIAKAMNAFV